MADPSKIERKRAGRLGNLRQILNEARLGWVVFVVVFVAYLGISWQGQLVRGNLGTLSGDESRYINYASELWQFIATLGKHSLDTSITLSNGPGYPLYLLLLKFLGLSHEAIRLSNALLIAAGARMLFLSATPFASMGRALLLVLLVLIHPKLIWYASSIMSESFAFFLGSCLCFSLVRPRRSALLPAYLLPAIIFAGLILTKVIFAYVALALAVAFLLFYLVARRASILQFAAVAALSLALCAPFLLHTWRASGQIFYWSSMGGPSLYWMSTPYEDEHGDWNGNTYMSMKERCEDGGVLPIYENHRAFFAGLPEDPIERDAAMRQEALRNIASNPMKLVGNMLANLSRMFMDFPFAVRKDNASPWNLVDIAYGAPLLLFCGALSWIVLANLARVPGAIAFSFAALAIYISGHLFLSAFGRMIIPALPLIFVCAAYAMGNGASSYRAISSEVPPRKE